MTAVCCFPAEFRKIINGQIFIATGFFFANNNFSTPFFCFEKSLCFFEFSLFQKQFAQVLVLQTFSQEKACVFTRGAFWRLISIPFPFFEK